MLVLRLTLMFFDNSWQSRLPCQHRVEMDQLATYDEEELPTGDVADSHGYRQTSHDEDASEYAHAEQADEQEDDPDSAQEAYYASALRQDGSANVHRTPQANRLRSNDATTPSMSRQSLPPPSFASPNTSFALAQLEDNDTDGLQSGLATVPSTPPLGPVTAPPPKKLLAAGLAAMKRNLIPGLCLQALALTIIIIYYSSDAAQVAFGNVADFKTQTGYLFSAISTAIFGGVIPWLINFLKSVYQQKKEEKAKAMAKGLNLQTGNLSGGVAVPAQSVLLTGSDIPLEDLSSLHDLESPPTTEQQRRNEIVWTNGTPKNILAGSLPDPGKPAPWAECLFLTVFWAYKGIEVDAFYRLQALMFGNGSDFLTIFAKVVVDQFVYNPVWAAVSGKQGRERETERI